MSKQLILSGLKRERNVMKFFGMAILIIITTLCIGYGGYKLVKTELSKEVINFNLDTSKFGILSGQNGLYNFLSNGIDHEIKFEKNDNWASNFVKSIFIINKNLICLVLGKHVNYYENDKGMIVKSFEIETDTIAVNTNENGDLLLFSGGSLYEYYFSKDALIKLKDIVQNDSDHSTNYPSLYIHPNKISYSKARNSVFYAAFTDPKTRTPGIYELSLNDYSVTYRVAGFCPQVKDSENCIYYINIKQDSIVKAEFSDFKESLVLSYPNVLRDMVIMDDETIFFIHASEKASIKGTRFDTFKIYVNSRVLPVDSKGSIYRSPFDVIRIE
jgi:hypothetical protein